MSLLQHRLTKLRAEYPTATEERKRAIEVQAERIKRGLEWPVFSSYREPVPEPDLEEDIKTTLFK